MFSCSCVATVPRFIADTFALRAAWRCSWMAFAFFTFGTLPFMVGSSGRSNNLRGPFEAAGTHAVSRVGAPKVPATRQAAADLHARVIGPQPPRNVAAHGPRLRRLLLRLR